MTAVLDIPENCVNIVGCKVACVVITLGEDALCENIIFNGSPIAVN